MSHTIDYLPEDPNFIFAEGIFELLKKEKLLTFLDDEDLEQLLFKIALAVEKEYEKLAVALLNNQLMVHKLKAETESLKEHIKELEETLRKE